MCGIIRTKWGRLAALLALPLLGIGMTEIGRAIYQATTVQNSLRAGALYAARNEFPLSAAALAQVENVVKTGDPTGTSSYLASGWAEAGASVQIEDLSFNFAGSRVPAIRISATVPYDPLLPRLFLVPAFNIELSHVQAFVQ